MLPSLIISHFHRRLRRRFSAVLGRGLEHLAAWERSASPSGPLILAANHSSWWDAVLPILISRIHFDHDARGLMERRQLERFPLFRKIGMLPIDRYDARRALSDLEGSASEIAGHGRVLWLFPQGRIEPNDQRPLRCERGAARLVTRALPCRLAVVAFRYEMGRDELPTAWIAVDLPTDVEDGVDERELCREIGQRMERLLDELREDAAADRRETFELIVAGGGRRSDRDGR